MKFFSIYTLDLFICLKYLLFSYLTCWFIFFNYIEILFLFETYPLLHILSTKRFILTQITQLFNTIWFYSLTTASIFIFPLLIHQLKYFLTSGWYTYQLKLYNVLSINTLLIFITLYFLIHIWVIPNIIHFFLHWEVLDEYSLLRIESEISLYFYIVWIITFKFTTIFILITFYKVLIFMSYFTKTNFIYFLLLKLKKIFIFSIIFLLFLLTPPEVITQILITFYVYAMVELFFFHTCIKYIIKNAYSKTIIKKTTQKN